MSNDVTPAAAPPPPAPTIHEAFLGSGPSGFVEYGAEIDFAAGFGSVIVSRSPATPLKERPEIMVVSNIRDDGGLALGTLPDGALLRGVMLSIARSGNESWAMALP